MGGICPAGFVDSIYPKTSDNLQVCLLDDGRSIARHRRDGPVMSLASDETRAVLAMDGSRSLAELQDELRARHGAFSHHDLVLLLFRLWDHDLLANGAAVRAALFPEHGERCRDRDWSRLARLVIVATFFSTALGRTLRALAPIGRVAVSTPALIAGGILSAVPLVLLLTGEFSPPDILFRTAEGWVSGIVTVYLCSAALMSYRGLVRSSVIAANGLVVPQSGLQTTFGVIHFDVDDREMDFVDRGRQLRFAVAGLASLGGAAGVLTLAATLGGHEVFAHAAVAAFIIGMVDLCPFIGSHGARIVGVIASVDHPERRVRGYINRRVVRDLMVSERAASNAYPIVATLWVLWFFAAVEVFRVFFVADIVELAVAVFTTDDMLLRGLGGAFVLYDALVIVVIAGLVLYTVASLLFQAVTPDRAARPTESRPTAALSPAERIDLVERIGALPFARALLEPTRASLVDRMSELTFEPGRWIQRAGKRDHRFFIVMDGQVDLIASSEDGARKLVATLGPGDCFGEEGLTGHAPLHDARAHVRCRLLGFDGDAFGTIVGEADDSQAQSYLELAEFLDAVPEMAGLGPSGRLELATRVALREVQDGTPVVVEGDAPEHMYVVRSGTFRVHSGEVTLAELGPGQTFGEIGLMLGRPRSATVTSCGPATLIEIPKAALHQALTRSFHVGLALERLATTRAPQ